MKWYVDMQRDWLCCGVGMKSVFAAKRIVECVGFVDINLRFYVWINIPFKVKAKGIKKSNYLNTH